MVRKEERDDLAGIGAVDADAILAGLLRDDLRPLRAHFAANGSAAPSIVWSPRRADLSTPILRSFAEVCDALATDHGLLESDRLRLEDFDGLDRWMMVLMRDGTSWRYIHYGSEIASHYGLDATGRTTADFGSFIGTFFTALYDAAAHRRERVLSVHEPSQRIFVRLWRRLIVPLAAETGEIVGFAVANVPDNELRAGLDMIVDPVFVADGDGIVQYCNGAAASYFGIASTGLRPLSELAGLDIAALPAPELLLARREVVDRLELFERKGGLMERLAVSVSAAEHRGRAYYIVLLRRATPD